MGDKIANGEKREMRDEMRDEIRDEISNMNNQLSAINCQLRPPTDDGAAELQLVAQNLHRLGTVHVNLR